MPDKSPSNPEADASRGLRPSNAPTTGAADTRPDVLWTLLEFCGNANGFKQLNHLLEEVTQLVGRLLPGTGAAILLLDRDKETLGVAAADFKIPEMVPWFGRGHHPGLHASADRVCRSGKASIVNHLRAEQTSSAPVDAGPDGPAPVVDRMDVPLRIQGRIVGVLSAIQQPSNPFGPQDLRLLSGVAGLTALAMENIRTRESLADYYRRMKDFNRAKDRVVHQLSHALKTPLAVLIACLELMKKYLGRLPEDGWHKIYDRAQRNLARLLSIEYEIEDILRQRHDSRYTMESGLSALGASGDQEDCGTSLPGGPADNCHEE